MAPVEIAIALILFLAEIVADTYGDRCQIETVWVAEGHRRQGVATAMVSRLRELLPDVRPALFHTTGDGQALSDALVPIYGETTTRKEGRIR